MQIHSKKNLKTNMENYSWEIVQNMIEREVNAAFKLRVDPEYKLKENLKRSFRNFIKNTNVKASWRELYTVEEFRNHIDSSFQDGMSWDNHGMGKGKWQIDHKKEVAQYIKEGITDVNIINEIIPFLVELKEGLLSPDILLVCFRPVVSDIVLPI